MLSSSRCCYTVTCQLCNNFYYAGLCHVVGHSAQQQARVLRMHSNKIKPSGFLTTRPSNVARWHARERLIAIFLHCVRSIFCLEREEMARQTGDDLAGLPLPVSRSPFLLCVVCVVSYTVECVCEHRCRHLYVARCQVS